MARLALALGIFADLGSVRRLNNTRAEKMKRKRMAVALKFISIHHYTHT